MNPGSDCLPISYSYLMWLVMLPGVLILRIHRSTLIDVSILSKKYEIRGFQSLLPV